MTRTAITVHDPAAQIINRAHNRMLKYNHERGFEANQQKPDGGLLYHYTTAEGLKGIVDNDEIWATSAYYMNDSAEILYGYRVLHRAIESWINGKNLPDDSIARGYAESLVRYFGHDALERNIVTPVYLTCFCEEANLLSQWRAYGSAGGYNIGFRVPMEGIVYGITPEPLVYTARCVKVEYDVEKQLRRVRELLDFLLPILDEQDVTESVRSIDTTSPLGFSQLQGTIQEMLLEECMGFKDPAFTVEKEWRFIVRSRAHLKQSKDDGNHVNLPIHFRTARGQIIPYVKLKPNRAPMPIVGDGTHMPIENVTCGPGGDRIWAGMAIRALLDGREFRSVRVNHSEIPLMF
jgi:hypothetical protein